MMQTKTLRGKFIVRLLIILISVSIVSGGIQFYYLYNEVKNNVKNEALMIGQSVQQGITETDLASRSIERQIDYRMELYSERIADHLPQQVDRIDTLDLNRMKQQFGVAGISIFARKGNDIVVVKSTDPKELGFSLKPISKEGFQSLNDLLNGKKPDGKTASYVNDNIVSLFTARSGSHGDKPEFFKYAYYHEPGTNYIINPYIEADEVYQFTEEVGPDSWIKQVLKQNPYAKEIAVLDPRVYANPSLAKKMYPPLKKVVYGTYHYADDDKTLVEMAGNPVMHAYIRKVQGRQIYKMFIPFDKGRVIYIALDFGKMSAPIYKHSIILIVFGFISLLALFMLTARFFNTIYLNIQKIKHHMGLLESGDFTGRSDVADGSELQSLSQSANKMTETLREVLSDTSEHAAKVQRLSAILESDANQSVQSMYTVSAEATMNQREAVEKILDFLFHAEAAVSSADANADTAYIREHIESMREMAGTRAASTTDLTIRLSDLLRSLHGQSKEMAAISDALLDKIRQFKLSPDYTPTGKE